MLHFTQNFVSLHSIDLDYWNGIDAIFCCCVADAINAKATAATQKGGSKCCDGCSSVDDGNWNFTAWCAVFLTV